MNEQTQFMQMLQQSLHDQQLASPTVGTGENSETAPITSVDALLSAASAVQITAGTAGPSPFFLTFLLLLSDILSVLQQQA